ncbi:hypothetical protein SAMN05421688_1445 [Poseidonocella pacifica]|uniref:DUF1344 domain-containing protein n=1 Tax=Poseidonocella pacifica TaxID=871651 RepID=A0A1I0WIV0_9RHOB|nr:hypothetical protein [Poseidonocella pacifica]SFA88158.1 hypothetical protein SAMN05421688_1445 [Poseidonocella pacifica]
MRALLAALVALAATTATADQTTGKVVSFDARSKVLVMADKTVWELGSVALLPEGITTGDTLQLTYETAGEDGLTSIDLVEKIGG